MKRRVAKSSHLHYSTIEIAHSETRNGIVLQLEGVQSPAALEDLVAHATERAASLPAEQRRVNDPGWWAAMICSESLRRGFPASVLRVPAYSRIHAALVVEHGQALALWPDWPVLRIADGRSSAATITNIDPRSGELARDLPPTEIELSRYRARVDTTLSVSTLMSAFASGVIEWDPTKRDHDGRRRLRPTFGVDETEPA